MQKLMIVVLFLSSKAFSKIPELVPVFDYEFKEEELDNKKLKILDLNKNYGYFILDLKDSEPLDPMEGILLKYGQELVLTIKDTQNVLAFWNDRKRSFLPHHISVNPIEKLNPLKEKRFIEQKIRFLNKILRIQHEKLGEFYRCLRAIKNDNNLHTRENSFASFFIKSLNLAEDYKEINPKIFADILSKIIPSYRIEFQRKVLNPHCYSVARHFVFPAIVAIILGGLFVANNQVIKDKIQRIIVELRAKSWREIASSVKDWIVKSFSLAPEPGGEAERAQQHILDNFNNSTGMFVSHDRMPDGVPLDEEIRSVLDERPILPSVTTWTRESLRERLIRNRLEKGNLSRSVVAADIENEVRSTNMNLLFEMFSYASYTQRSSVVFLIVRGYLKFFSSFVSAFTAIPGAIFAYAKEKYGIAKIAGSVAASYFAYSFYSATKKRIIYTKLRDIVADLVSLKTNFVGAKTKILSPHDKGRILVVTSDILGCHKYFSSTSQEGLLTSISLIQQREDYRAVERLLDILLDNIKHELES